MSVHTNLLYVVSAPVTGTAPVVGEVLDVAAQPPGAGTQTSSYRTGTTGRSTVSWLDMSGLVGYGSSDEEGENGGTIAADVKVPLSSLNYHASHLTRSRPRVSNSLQPTSSAPIRIDSKSKRTLRYSTLLRPR